MAFKFNNTDWHYVGVDHIRIFILEIYFSKDFWGKIVE